MSRQRFIGLEVAASALRDELLEPHRRFLALWRQHVILAGPYLDPTHGKTCGSMLLIRAESLEQAREFANTDPYTQAGLFAELHVFEWYLRSGLIDLNEACGIIVNGH